MNHDISKAFQYLVGTRYLGDTQRVHEPREVIDVEEFINNKQYSFDRLCNPWVDMDGFCVLRRSDEKELYSVVLHDNFEEKMERYNEMRRLEKIKQLEEMTPLEKIKQLEKKQIEVRGKSARNQWNQLKSIEIL